MAEMNNEVVLGFLGLGNIGGGVYNLLRDFAQELTARSGVRFRVKKALVRAFAEIKRDDLPAGLLTETPAEVLDDPEIDIVCEFMGGEHPAADFMLRALENGKSVVTANKVAFALNWDKLEAAAKAHGAGLYYEAAVCGAIPIMDALHGALQSSRVERVMGIINGTTNYILSRMSANGEDYAAVLADAQRLGLAEPNPATDVEGLDAAYKLSILSSLAFHTHVPYSRVYCEGITNVSALDIASGKELGYALKLLAIGKRDGDTVEVRVHPTFIPADHPLAMVNGSFNAVYLYGHACKEMMFQGRGAGDMPTASAIVADLIRAATQKPAYANFPVTAEADPALTFTDNWLSSYYIRISAADQPGVLAEIAGCLAGEGVSISAMLQKRGSGDACAPMIFITHAAREQAVQAAIRRLNPKLCTVENVIRVEA